MSLMNTPIKIKKIELKNRLVMQKLWRRRGFPQMGKFRIKTIHYSRICRKQ